MIRPTPDELAAIGLVALTAAELEWALVLACVSAEGLSMTEAQKLAGPGGTKEAPERLSRATTGNLQRRATDVEAALERCHDLMHSFASLAMDDEGERVELFHPKTGTTRRISVEEFEALSDELEALFGRAHRLGVAAARQRHKAIADSLRTPDGPS
jgi:hypothetical protein